MASGVNNGAISLNGTASAYVSFPAELVSGLTNCTIAAWVFLNASNAWQRIFDFGSGTGTYMFLTPEAGAGGPLRFAITTKVQAPSKKSTRPPGYRLAYGILWP
jgi:hypothetical protein